MGVTPAEELTVARMAARIIGADSKYSLKVRIYRMWIV